MLRISSLLISTAFLAAVLFITPSKGWAAELPAGVTVSNGRRIFPWMSPASKRS